MSKTSKSEETIELENELQYLSDIIKGHKLTSQYHGNHGNRHKSDRCQKIKGGVDHRKPMPMLTVVDSLPGGLTGKITPNRVAHNVNTATSNDAQYNTRKKTSEGGSAINRKSFYSRHQDITINMLDTDSQSSSLGRQVTPAMAIVSALPGSLEGSSRKQQAVSTISQVSSLPGKLTGKTGQRIHSHVVGQPSAQITSFTGRTNTHTSRDVTEKIMTHAKRHAHSLGSTPVSQPTARLAITQVSVLPGTLTGKTNIHPDTPTMKYQQPKGKARPKRDSKYCWVSSDAKKSQLDKMSPVTSYSINKLHRPTNTQLVARGIVGKYGRKIDHSSKINTRHSFVVSKYKMEREKPTTTPLKHNTRHFVSTKYKINKLKYRRQTKRFTPMKRSPWKMAAHRTKHHIVKSKRDRMRWTRHQEPDTISINKVLGRKVINKSKNKYKFIHGSKVLSYSSYSPSYVSRRFHSNRLSRYRSNMKVDNRTKSKRKMDTHRTVVIGGVPYRCSSSKLSRHSLVNRYEPHKKGPLKVNMSRRTNILTVRGVSYRADSNGKVLRRITPTKGAVAPSGGSYLPRIDIRGVTYVQERAGTLVRSNLTNTRVLASKALHTALHTAKYKKTARKYCMFYNRFAKCRHGDSCRFVHDPTKVAVCTRFIRGTCKIDQCPFSHKIEPDKMPVCSYFLQGTCSRDNCPYLHVNVNKNAEVCRDFLMGYCPLGKKCKKKHVRICKTFELTGACAKGAACKLKHLHQTKDCSARRHYSKKGTKRKQESSVVSSYQKHQSEINKRLKLSTLEIPVDQTDHVTPDVKEDDIIIKPRL